MRAYKEGNVTYCYMRAFTEIFYGRISMRIQKYVSSIITHMFITVLKEECGAFLEIFYMRMRMNIYRTY